MMQSLLIKAAMLAVLDGVRDESSREAAVRLVFEPKSSRIDSAELIRSLLAHTSLETSVSINLTMVGIDGKPVLKSGRQMLLEWIVFRQGTIERRSRHRLQKVLDRIHILEGRQLVLLNIDEVIAIIRQSDEPKAALIERFALSERQAEDILEIRLRQLARLKRELSLQRVPEHILARGVRGHCRAQRKGQRTGPSAAVRAASEPAQGRQLDLKGSGQGQSHG